MQTSLFAISFACYFSSLTFFHNRKRKIIISKR